MAWLAEIWPFAPGQQHMIFNVAGSAVIGLIALNVYSAVRQRLPLQKVLSGFFVEIGTSSGVEKRIRFVLMAWLLLGFLVLVLDVQVNGNQIVDTSWTKNR